MGPAEAVLPTALSGGSLFSVPYSPGMCSTNSSATVFGFQCQILCSKALCRHIEHHEES